MMLVSAKCAHMDLVLDVVPRTPEGCEECLKTGASWEHLRVCLTCGHVGCCDNSAGGHASLHAKAEDHPVIRSFQPGEDWGWCYVDEVYLFPKLD